MTGEFIILAFITAALVVTFIGVVGAMAIVNLRREMHFAQKVRTHRFGHLLKPRVDR